MSKANDSLTKSAARAGPATNARWPAVEWLANWSADSVRRPASTILVVNLALTGGGVALVGSDQWWRAGQEYGLMTLASVLNLAFSAFLCLRIYEKAGGRIDRFLGALDDRRSGRFVWWLMAVGFCFLTLDEGLGLHEKAEHLVNAVASAAELGPNDWIDDALVGLYGVAAAWILWRARDGLKWLWPQRGLLVSASALFVIMVALDVTSGSQETIGEVVGRDAIIDTWVIKGRIDFVVSAVLNFLEELTKLALGVVIVLILLMTYHRALEDD